jgi:hypothetical protein
MRIKAIAVSSILFISVFMLLVSCGKEKAKWKGTIEEENGITVVRNPKEPMYGEDVLSLEEELSIGEKEGSEEYMFSQIIDLGVDDGERIYILDFQEAHIKVFDKKGEYLRTIGKRGQGPGEIQRPMNLIITPGGQILVNDRGARFLHFFTLSGEYIRSISQATTFHLSRPKVDSKDNIVARYSVPGNAWSFILKKFDSNLNEILTIFSYEYVILPGVMTPFPPQCYWDIADDDSIIWGYGEKYEIQILHPDGRLIRKIVKDYEPIRITEGEKQKWIKDVYGEQAVPPDIKVSWRKHHNAFGFMNIDDAGRIYVQTYEKTSHGNGYYYDVFDSEGKCIAKIPLKFQPLIWKKNKVYTIEEDEKEYLVVKRYKANWNF